MTLLLYVARLLVLAGACESPRFDCRDLDEVALDVAEACEADAPVLPPHGRVCAEVAVSIFAVETGYTFELYPRATSGCGPGQVLGAVNTRPCTELRVPRVGFAWLVQVYRWKLARVGSERAAVRAYNGSQGKDGYEQAVRGVLRRLRADDHSGGSRGGDRR